MNVSDATFVVTDVETTGTKAAAHRVIEVGAVRVEGGEIVDRFQQLVNPERSVPSRITQITGITTGMVFDAPPMDVVMPQYLDFLGDGILVAHNLPFDLGFLNAELARLDRPELDHDTLCTLRLARRLLPGLKSKGLTRLAQFYGVTVDGRHRALGDAEATGVILNRFFGQLDFEHAVDTVEDLLAFQHRSYKSVRSVPNHLKKLRESVLPELPDRPGVYFLKSSGGTILYIGKAKSLDSRVRSYFNAIESHGPRKRKLMNKVRAVDWDETGTELEALLLESRLIKTHKPYYNKAQRRYRRRPFIRLDTTKRFPTVSSTTSIVDDGAEYYGPLRNLDQADLVVEIVGRFFQLRECDDAELSLGRRCLYADLERCTAPCENEDDTRYAAAVERTRRFLTGRDDAVLDELEARMQQASDNLEFEKAAEFRDWLKQLDRMLQKQEAVASPVLQHNAAVLHERDDDHVDVLLVRFGRFVESVSCRRPIDDRDREAVREAIVTHFGAGGRRPEALSVRAIDEIRLLSHWMYAQRRDVRSIRWESGGADVEIDDATVDVFTQRVLRAVEARDEREEASDDVTA